MFSWFKRKPGVAVDEPNPWLKIEHEHHWLEANLGVELVCGLCGLRKPNTKAKRKSL